MLAFRPLLLGLLAGWLVSQLLPPNERQFLWAMKAIGYSKPGSYQLTYEAAESLMDSERNGST